MKTNKKMHSSLFLKIKLVSVLIIPLEKKNALKDSVFIIIIIIIIN